MFDNETLLLIWPLDLAEQHGDCLVYPIDHDKIWLISYRKIYYVDFYCYTRGRIVYDQDGSIESLAKEFNVVIPPIRVRYFLMNTISATDVVLAILSDSLRSLKTFDIVERSIDIVICN